MNRPPRSPGRPPVARPLGDDDIARLQQLLDALPPPCEPLDASMLDGYLCGVLLQPCRVTAGDWLPTVLDAAGGTLPVPPPELVDLLQRRHAELDAAIERRDWFDPWVFELDVEGPAGEGGAHDGESEDPAAEATVPIGHAGKDIAADAAGEATAGPADAVYPWVAGFALAMERFAGLMALDAPALLEPLALLYRHLGADDLEDADELVALIETFEPPGSLDDAVEELVRATLLLADVSRPRRPGAGGARRAGSAPGAKRDSRR